MNLSIPKPTSLIDWIESREINLFSQAEQTRTETVDNMIKKIIELKINPNVSFHREVKTSFFRRKRSFVATGLDDQRQIEHRFRASGSTLVYSAYSYVPETGESALLKLETVKDISYKIVDLLFLDIKLSMAIGVLMFDASDYIASCARSDKNPAPGIWSYKQICEEFNNTKVAHHETSFKSLDQEQMHSAS